jgi:hypothetical protein
MLPWCAIGKTLICFTGILTLCARRVFGHVRNVAFTGTVLEFSQSVSDFTVL